MPLTGVNATNSHSPRRNTLGSSATSMPSPTTKPATITLFLLLDCDAFKGLVAGGLVGVVVVVGPLVVVVLVILPTVVPVLELTVVVLLVVVLPTMVVTVVTVVVLVPHCERGKSKPQACRSAAVE